MTAKTELIHFSLSYLTVWMFSIHLIKQIQPAWMSNKKLLSKYQDRASVIKCCYCHHHRTSSMSDLMTCIYMLVEFDSWYLAYVHACGKSNKWIIYRINMISAFKWSLNTHQAITSPSPSFYVYYACTIDSLPHLP